LNGRYGPYITDGAKNGKIPKDRDPKTLTLDECKALIAAAPARGPRWGRKAAPAKGAKAAKTAEAAAPETAAKPKKPAAKKKAAPKKKAAAKKKAAPKA
jgi:DNA topoisomerase-1